jgi:protein-S-isoprenylcysteine O-methyltransferase Ste14
MPPEQSKRIPHPGVTIPPPFYFTIGFLAGWLLHRAFPLPVPDVRDSATRVAGWILIALSVTLTLWAMATFRRHRTTVIPHRPASRMVTDGPYARSRNPMYLSMTAFYLGLAILTGMLWPLLLLPVVLALLIVFVIQREERYLADAFGAEYAAYCARVRRWL